MKFKAMLIFILMMPLDVLGLDYSIVNGVPMNIPVTGGASQIAALRTLVELPIQIDDNDIIRVTCRATATSEDLADRGRNVNWVLQVRIEPTSGNNWGTNFNPVTGQDSVSPFNGWQGIKNNGNISPDMHHDSRESSTTWTGVSGVWYAKCVSRSHASAAITGDELEIDLSQIEVLFLN